MKTSVVVPAFERLGSLRAVLQSCRQNVREEDIEVLLVDDKSPYGQNIEELAREYDAIYVRNNSGRTEREAALCRNLGLEASTGEIIIFNDGDIILAPTAMSTHKHYHSRLVNIVIDAQVWSIPEGEPALERLPSLRLGDLKHRARPSLKHVKIRWSRLTGRILPWSVLHPSKDWLPFLSAQCSFKREDVLRVGGWDENYSGWGFEDTDMAYRLYKSGLSIIYAADIPCFHIDHPMSQEEYIGKCETALRNLKYMMHKYPELSNENALIRQLQNLESQVKGDISHTARQGSAGGGPIISSEGDL
jgi:glycosyltransferase involved in cell wall biosynthesis